VVMLPVADEVEEAVRLAQQITLLSESEKIPLRDIAVLYRTNLQSQLIEEQLLNFRIPYHVVGHRFFERREILDVLLWLKLVENPDDTLVLEELLDRPKKRVSAKSQEKLKLYRREKGLTLSQLFEDPASLPITDKEKVAMLGIKTSLDTLREQLKTASFPDFVRFIVEDMGIRVWYKERETKETATRGTSPVDNLNRLITVVTTNYSGQALELLPEFLHYVTLMSDDETDDQDGVQLMTLHSAKGTEYRIVFMVGVEENIIPHWRSLRDEKDPAAAIEEERRLCYVGMTRAKELLYLMYSRQRTTPSGKLVSCQPSRFIKEIPDDLMVRWQKGK
jgi:DNA helicase-2/ATP-dependent DNA helicase PcrA